MRLIIENARFRLLWFSGTVNNLGIILYFTVHGWLTLAVTDSAFWVGATAGVHGVALVVFSVLAGVLADRFDRRRLLLYGQTIQAAMAFAIAALVFTEQIALWHILLAGILEGMVVAVKVPCRMTLTQDVVGRERLLSATAANMVSMTAMGIGAPLLGGFVVGVFDIAWGYVIIGGAYLVASLLLTALRGVPRLARTLSTPWQDMKSGVHYVFATPAVRALILLGVTSEVFGWAHESMLPVMARDVLKVGPQGLGYLLAAGSVGGFLSTQDISSRRDIQNKRRMLLLGYAGFGVFLVLFAF
ncbi:MAG: MFS transporter, partial [Chloroflexi bacterium]|nr:MFS transporter [Chloroflexota bacterium]